MAVVIVDDTAKMKDWIHALENNQVKIEQEHSGHRMRSINDSKLRYRVFPRVMASNIVIVEKASSQHPYCQEQQVH